ncbi:MAG: hypothetical protein IIX97_03370, partial [Clostridia bacterium]|nr:hypothetical protein [Clostridia bacterium]
LNGENAATKKFPQTEAYGLWEFYLYRQKRERRQAPSGRARDNKAMLNPKLRRLLPPLRGPPPSRREAMPIPFIKFLR